MTLIGVDMGGTHLRAASVARDGATLRRLTRRTEPERGPGAALASVSRTIHELIADESSVAADASRLAIGLAVSGPVDTETGIVSNPYTLGGWPPTDLLSPLRREFPQAAIAIENDANAAAVGEWRVGAARGASRVVMVTIGTGIGVASVVAGEVQRASRSRHGEAGHIPLNPSGPECYCGARGCWESLASGAALGQKLDGASFDAADPRHLDILRETARWTGLGLVTLCATMNPDVIVIGGGLSRYFELMHETIAECMRQHGAMIPTDVPLRVAKADDFAGVIGAAFIADKVSSGEEA